jgi:hypothetical protein
MVLSNHQPPDGDYVQIIFASHFRCIAYRRFLGRIPFGKVRA